MDKEIHNLIYTLNSDELKKLKRWIDIELYYRGEK